MLLNIFAKKRTATDGKAFYSYLTTLTKKDGDQETVQVKFREDCGQPKGQECPRVIEVKKENANLVKRTITVLKGDTEEEVESRTLWVSGWVDKGEYVDHSLDDYDFE